MRRFLKYGYFLLSLLPGLVMGAADSAALHYQVIPSTVTEELVMHKLIAEHPGQIPVIEFFSFGCHWCHDLEPYLQSWLKNKPKDVTLVRVPVVFHPTWRPLAKAYFTAQLLEQSVVLESALFKAIHEDHIILASDEDVRTLFIKNGVSAQKFDEVYSSFAVNQNLKWAEEMTRLYQIKQVPTIVVVGHKGVYLTTLQLAGGKENFSSTLTEILNQ